MCRDAAPAAAPPAGRRRSSAELAAEEAAGGVGGPGRVLAVTSGFLVPPPVGLMHCDALQVFTRGMRGEEGARARGGVLGLGLLLGAATFAFGRAAGCRRAEILAINGALLSAASFPAAPRVPLRAPSCTAPRWCTCGAALHCASAAALQPSSAGRAPPSVQPRPRRPAHLPRPRPNRTPHAADDDAWHERLVAYYSRFGFVPVRTVTGSGLGDLPHMLVWGGAGTRMDADVEGMLRRWTRAVRRNSAAGAAAAASGAAAMAAAAAAADAGSAADAAARGGS